MVLKTYSYQNSHSTSSMTIFESKANVKLSSESFVSVVTIGAPAPSIVEACTKEARDNPGFEDFFNCLMKGCDNNRDADWRVSASLRQHWSTKS